MFRKLDTKILIFVLIGLLVVVAGVTFFDRSKGERSFKESLVQTDSEKIDHILLFPKNSKGNGIELKRAGSGWTVSQNGISYPADNLAITDLIGSLNPLRTESVVSTNPKQHKDFDLLDSLATRVKMLQGTTLIADLLIGRPELSSNQNMSTFVRLFKDNEVYSVAGYLSMIANREMDSYRNHKLVEGSKADWSKLEFIYPADSSFVLEKQSEGKWHVGPVDLDNTEVDKILDPLQNLEGTKFSAALPPSRPLYKLRISGSKLNAPIELEGYADATKNIVIRSSLNEGNLFDGNGLTDKVFPGKNRLKH